MQQQHHHHKQYLPKSHTKNIIITSTSHINNNNIHLNLTQQHPPESHTTTTIGDNGEEIKTQKSMKNASTTAIGDAKFSCGRIIGHRSLLCNVKCVEIDQCLLRRFANLRRWQRQQWSLRPKKRGQRWCLRPKKRWERPEEI